MSNFGENSDYLRSVFLGKSFKKIIEEKNITITKIAENMNTSQPAISNVLNGKKYASDTFFTKIAKAIPLTEPRENGRTLCKPRTGAEKAGYG